MIAKQCAKPVSLAISVPKINIGKTKVKLKMEKYNSVLLESR